MMKSAVSASENSGEGRLSPSNTSDRHQQQEQQISPVALDASTTTTTTTKKLAFLPPTINDDGTAVSFSLANVNENLVCRLCSGYYKEPFTLHECLHTFCKSCIFYSVASCNLRQCPECGIYVGREINKFASHDANLGAIVDCIFPEFKAKEDRDCETFYRSRGIKRKTEDLKEMTKNSETTSRPPTGGDSKDDIEFALFPQRLSKGDEKEQLDPLDKPFLHVSGKLKMNQLKRYVVSLRRGNKKAEKEEENLDILCNGVPVGDEISLSFVKRLLWPHEESILELTYKRK